MKRIISAAAAAGMLVAGAFVASSITSSPADAQVLETQIAESETNEEVGPREAALDEVLAALVADGTLDQGQADAVKEALEAKGEELRAEREARREERQAQRELIKGFLEDDVITSDELAQLGDDHPFNDPDGIFADAVADGELTKDELKELRREHRPRARGGASNDGSNA